MIRTIKFPIGTSKATLTVYLLDKLSCNPDKLRPAILICPGGGYIRVSDREATPVATQYLAAGCHAMVLDYTVAPGRFPAALTELAAAVALIRARAAEWLVDPAKIIINGFSAGGHLACSLGAFWNQEVVNAPLKTTPDQIQPNGLILCYPVITAGPDCHAGSFQSLLGDKASDPAARDFVSLEHQVGPHTPKTFLWHTCPDQSVPVTNSLLLAAALLKANIELELHLYPTGSHGLSLATEEVSSSAGEYIAPQCQSWIPLVKTWIQHL